jgi:uncharacterized protein YdhG (YjbR/CyaY superfamily)
MPHPVDVYIKTFPKEVHKKLQEVRRVIREVAPGAEEVMGYGVPTFKLNGNLVHFAGYAKHIGFYPGPAGLTAFAKDIAKYKHAKGSFQFPLDAPLPLALIKKITKFRLKQNMEKIKNR